MQLLKTAFLSSVITFVRISSGFVANKIISIITGPSGIGLIGSFSNFITIVYTFANGAISNGVVKYTAEYSKDEIYLKKLFSTSLKISIFFSLIIGIPLILAGPFISNLFFSISYYGTPMRIMGVILIFFSINNLLLSILNGKSEINIYTLINSIGTILGLILTIVLVYLFNVQGALYSMIISPSIVFIVNILIVRKMKCIDFSFFKEKICVETIKNLSQYSLMASISALCVPLSQIIIRNTIISKFGLNEAGYWQGMLRISEGYLMVITTALSTYYLPKLSSLRTNYELRREIFSGARIILPTVLFGAFVIFFFRYIIIRTFYSKEFLLMENLFAPQLVGDFFKMATWILAYLMLAKSMTKIFIITEIVFSSSLVILSLSLMPVFNVKGVPIAYAVNSFFGFLTMLFIFRKLLFYKQQ